MKDFELNSKMYKCVEITVKEVLENEDCFGCAFKEDDEGCLKAPECNTDVDGPFYIFVETSQNALQQ